MRLDALHRRVIMDASVIHTDLDAVLPAKIPAQYDNRVVYLRPLLRRVNTTTRLHNIHNDITNDPKVSKATVKFTAEWRPEELLPHNGSDADIHVHWMMHPRGRRAVMTQDTWTMFRFGYWSYVLHELVHRHQNYYRKDQSSPRVYRPISDKADIREEQQYLGDFDEIEAYAFDAALEMFARYPSDSWDENFAATKALPASTHTPTTYAIYKKTFAEAPHHPVITTFERKMHTWYAIMLPYRDFYRELELSAHDRPLFS